MKVITEKVNNKKRRIFTLIGSLSIIYFISLFVFGGKISFSEFWLLLGLVFLILGSPKIMDKLKPIYNRKIFKILFTSVIIVATSSFILIESLIIYYGSVKNIKNSDYLIILGAGLRGEQMSMTLHQRMEKGIEYLHKYPDTKVIVSGGQGPGESITEAEAMRRYLLNNGINENQIIKEEKSTSTEENLIYSIEVIKEKEIRKDLKVTVVTSNFHMFRANFLASRFGLSIYSAPSELHPLLIPNYYVREYLAVINSYLFNRGEN